jgi:hypothetical protein
MLVIIVCCLGGGSGNGWMDNMTNNMDEWMILNMMTVVMSRWEIQILIAFVEAEN